MKQVGFFATLLIFASILSGGCDDDSAEEETIVESETLPVRSLELESDSGCSIDADCVIGTFCFQNFCSHECTSTPECKSGQECSVRGRCHATGSDDAAAGFVEGAPGLRVVAPPQTIFEMAPGDTSVKLSFEVKGDAPDGRISYRITQGGAAAGANQIHHALVNDGRVEIEIEIDAVGRATLFDGTVENPFHNISVATTVGIFDLALVPTGKLDGVWGGELSVENFGGQAFEFELSLIGDTPDAMKVQMAVDSRSIFSPRNNNDSARRYEITDLVFNQALNRYQAIFKNEYRFSDGLFAGLPGRQVERSIRLDFDAVALRAGLVEGRFADSWRGLYDTQTQAGTEQVGQLSFTGSFEMGRVRDRIGATPVVGTAPAASPVTLPRGDLGDCVNPDFATVAAVDVNGTNYSCATVSTLAEFKNAGPVERANCAIAYSTQVLNGVTTETQLGRYFGAGPGVGDPSFEDFLDACGDDENPVCVPSVEALCAFELTAYAANDITLANLNGDALMANAIQAELLAQMSDSAHEAFLARQLGAFYADMNLRRDWLRNTAAPAVFLDAIEVKNLELLETWKTEVLDVQRDVFTHFFHKDALTLLGRATDGDAANAKRVKLLSEAGVLWHAYASALTLAADRWATIVRDETQRTVFVEYLQSRAVELYLIMGMLVDFNRAAGVAFEGASLAQGFSLLTTAIDRLATPHTDAVFARDAQVITATSLNPLSDNDSLLVERRTHALEVVEASRLSIEGILDEVNQEALTEADFRARLNTEMRESANRIVSICGLPPVCTAETLLSDPACAAVDLGTCGLANMANPDIDAAFDPSQVSVSEAGRAALAVLESFQTLAIEGDEVENHISKLDVAYSELFAFKNDIDQWDEQRSSNLDKLVTNLKIRDGIRDQSVADLAKNLAERATSRKAHTTQLRGELARWDRMRVGQIDTDYRTEKTAARLRTAGTALEALVGVKAGSFKTAADSMPLSTGTSSDTTSAARAQAMLASRRVTALGRAGKAAFESQASRLEQSTNYHDELIKAELQNLSELQDLKALDWEADLAALEGAAAKSKALSDNEIAALRDAVELGNAQVQVELAYGRDYAEFRSKNSLYQQQQIDTSTLILTLARAEFRVGQRMSEYRGLVLQASLENAKLVELRRQLTDLDNLVGGVGSIFTKSYALDRAESQLGAAREALMDWLVVLEYFAVRPFVAQRIQILLSRNAYQLEEISKQLQVLERECGGSERSKATETLSLRNDVFGLTRRIIDASDESELDESQRFQQMIRESYVPVNRRVRYSTSATLTQVLDHSDDILAAPFTLALSEFANLSLACNAKIESVGVQLVGEIGDGRPTVTVIYDGVSQLRSCQPNVDEYVRAFGNGMSDYGSISFLRTNGRAMSPLAGVNTFISSDEGSNRTLAGLPVASEYTLLIDTKSAANADFDWSKLEDVLIQVEYSYQDLFPSACD